MMSKHHKFRGNILRPCESCGKMEAHAIHHNVKYPHKDPRFN